MPRGRKKKPDAVRELEGDLSKRPKSKPLAVAVGELPEPPDDFGEFEQLCWDTLAEEMHRHGLLHHLDAHGLESYCRIYANARRCWIAGGDQPVVEIDGKPCANPYLKEARQLETLLSKLRSELGLNATSRTAAAADQLDQAKDEPADVFSFKDAG
ncbi:MAG: P27 family phage terminase small subunit [Planctomycetota bacterium]